MSFLNFINGGQSYLYDVSKVIAGIPNNQACYSGPDILPSETTLYSNSSSTYELLTRHPGCRSNSVQNDSFEEEGPRDSLYHLVCDSATSRDANSNGRPDCTLTDIFKFAVGGTFGDFKQNSPYDSGLCINSYLFWNNRGGPSATGLDISDAFPVIAAKPYGNAWYGQCVGGVGPP